MRSLSDWQSNLIVNLPEPKLIKNLKRLKDAFTNRTKVLIDYSNDLDLVSAYSQFYLPTNLPKLEFLFKQLPEGVLDSIYNAPFVDWGSGPGTYSLALLDYFSDKPFKQDITLVDKSKLMLDQGKKFLDGFYQEHGNIRYLESINPKDAEGATLLLGHSLNEVEAHKLSGLLESVKIIIIIEPGTPLAFKKVIKLRKEILGLGFQSVYPCPHDGECPLTLSESSIEKNDWCHQVLRAKHHPSIERISQIIQIDRRSMPLIGHVYIKEKLERSQISHPVRFLGESKFSFDYLFCHEENSELLKVELLKKYINKQELKEFRKTNLGDQIKFELVKQISKNHIKAKIIF
jgi:ribosomal protein RSM22 (predicted rRNA methylase)